jgi:hypothetical protein
MWIICLGLAIPYQGKQLIFSTLKNSREILLLTIRRVPMFSGGEGGEYPIFFAPNPIFGPLSQKKIWVRGQKTTLTSL